MAASFGKKVLAVESAVCRAGMWRQGTCLAAWCGGVVDKPKPFVFALFPQELKLQAQGVKVEALFGTASVPMGRGLCPEGVAERRGNG